MPNQIFVIEPYRYGGTWVFDDPKVDLEAEPFVSGMPEIIDLVLEQNQIDRVDRFRMLFSAQPFPEAETLKRGEAEYGGTWYTHEGSGLEGWLCPALFKYFDVAPDNLYCKVEGIRNEVPSLQEKTRTCGEADVS